MDQKFAFVDIETTGSNPVQNRVIEIAIVRVHGVEIVDRWSCLINPGIPIPSFIQSFTGINTEMLIDKPIFEEIADEILQRLDGYVFVAHNVRFDYGFLKNEFRRIGKTFNAKQLCTVKLSRSLYPDFRKHSLDAVMERFDFEPVTDRHRALGDADLLYQFWQKIHTEFDLEIINKSILQQKGNVRIPSKLQLEEFDKLPNLPGVYMFYAQDLKRPIYIGKSKSIKSRVLDHFSGEYNSFRKSRMVSQIQKIDYVTKAGELSALLYEADLVKEYLPLYNKRLRKNKILYLLKLNKSQNLYTVDIVKKVNPTYEELENSYGPFSSRLELNHFLEGIVKDYKICRKVLGLEKITGANKSCFNYGIEKCIGVCDCDSDMWTDKVVRHNKLLETVLEREVYEKWPFGGPVVLREICIETGEAEFHLVNKWCLIGSFESMEEALNVSVGKSDYDFDLDKYKLLKSFIRKNDIEIIQI